MFSGHGVFCLLGVTPGQQFIESGDRMPAGEFGQHIGEPSLRIDTAELAGFHQRRDGRPVFAAAVAAGEQGSVAKF